MVGMLITVIVLGIMVTIALNGLNHSSSTTTTSTIPGATTTTVPQTAGAGAQEAAISACEVNYQALETALDDYRALNGAYPPAGVTWATSTANGGPYLQQWPTSPLYYDITWNGAQLNVLPKRGTMSHGSDGTSSPKTGCFAA